MGDQKVKELIERLKITIFVRVFHTFHPNNFIRQESTSIETV